MKHNIAILLLTTTLLFACSSPDILLNENINTLIGSWESDFIIDIEGIEENYIEKLTFDNDMNITREVIFSKTTERNYSQNGNFLLYANPALPENFNLCLILNYANESNNIINENHFYVSFIEDSEGQINLQIIQDYENNKSIIYKPIK